MLFPTLDLLRCKLKPSVRFTTALFSLRLHLSDGDFQLTTTAADIKHL
jgi:hypothetical protein